MKTTFVSIVAGAGILLVTVFIVWGLEVVKPTPEIPASEPTPVSSAVVTLPETEEVMSDVIRTVTDGGSSTDPVSIPAFSQYELQGSDFTVGRVLADSARYTRYYITYGSEDLTISGIMNVPKGDGPFPVLFLNHGYIDPAVYTNGRGLKREQDYLAREGYIVVHSDYRNHAQSSKDPDSEFNLRLGYAKDVANGIDALREANLSYADTSRIGMLGHSMGGGVTEVIITGKPDLIDAAVLFAPVSGDVRDNFNKWTRTRQETANRILEVHGTFEENPEFWDNISPTTFVDRIQVPVMNHHGTEDESVPLEWSERFMAELEAMGKDGVLHVYPGEPHEFIDAWPTVMRRTATFFDEHLK